MFRPLTPEQMEELYLMYGKEDDDKVEMLARQFDATPAVLSLSSVMTSVPRVVVQGEMLPLVLIDTNYLYTVEKGVITVTTNDAEGSRQEICRMGAGMARDFYSASNHVPQGGSYICQQIAPTAERVPIPPSRLDNSASGQLKIMVDVVLALPLMRSTDSVVVVGSANMQSRVSGESYKLLEGAVRSVRLVDPNQQRTFYVSQGTMVNVIAEAQEKHVTCDFFFNDAAIGTVKDGFTDVKNIVVPFTARHYSLKCAGTAREQGRVMMAYRDMKKDFFRYVQISPTYEFRLTSAPRYFGTYHKRLGTCAACVEIDYHLPQDFMLSDWQYTVIRDIHSYGMVKCSMTQTSRPVDHQTINTVLMRTSFHPFYLTREVNVGAGGDPFAWEDRDKIKVTTQLVGSSIDIAADRFFFTETRVATDPVIAGKLCSLQEHYSINPRFARQSVIFISLGKRADRIAEVCGTWHGLLVLDSFVYELDYAIIDSAIKQEEIPQGGLFPTEQPVTKWWISRFRLILHRGLTAASLVAAISLVLRNHQYAKFGYY